MDNSELELSFMDHRHDSSEFELGVVMDGSVTHSFSQIVSTELPSVDFNDFEFFMFCFIHPCISRPSWTIVNLNYPLWTIDMIVVNLN